MERAKRNVCVKPAAATTTTVFHQQVENTEHVDRTYLMKLDRKLEDVGELFAFIVFVTGAAKIIFSTSQMKHWDDEY